jgi:O-antigen/teichoic acid export membrane protein
MQIKKDLFKVFSSNFINLLIGIITGFLVPAFLSLEEYAFLKTFTLYIGYVGILHFGFIDGIYLKYGGKYESEIDKKNLKGEHKFLILFQLLVTLLSCIIGIILDDKILVAFSICILPMNIQTFFKFIYQALGEFNIYSKIMILTPILLLFTNLFIIFILRIDNFKPFIIGNIISYYVVFIGLEVYFLRKYKWISAILNYTEIRKHFKIGSIIMVANLSSIFFYSVDRWFVKFTLPIEDFAFYSFAISMMSVINVLISSITMTLYPYLARNQNSSIVSRVKEYFLIIGTLASGGYFAFVFIVNNFLPKYVPSLNVISILFAGYPAIIVINALYINLYKAQKREKKYALAVGKMLLIAILLNFVAIVIYKSNLSIAIATTISFYIWYLYSYKDFYSLKIDIKEKIYLVTFFITFLITSNFLKWLHGLFIYYTIIILINFIFYKNEARSLIKDLLIRT